MTIHIALAEGISDEEEICYLLSVYHMVLLIVAINADSEPDVLHVKYQPLQDTRYTSAVIDR